ncbi:MAG: transglycosylase SLT domain-containing protein, partial [Proteobacteria bacterium]|nr:transglycosylase SLT domain-containing protein [Pseudomonadota bacterium]
MSTRALPKGPESWDRKMTLGRLFAASLLPVILITGAVWFYTTHPLPRFSITFVAADTERVFSTISPYGRGMEREMAEAFCKRYGLELHWIRTDTPEAAWEILASGRTQIMIGAGWRPEQLASDTHITPGPVYETHFPALLSHTRRHLDLIRPRICETEVLVQPEPALVNSLKAFGWSQECRAEYALLPDIHLMDLFKAENEQSTRPYLLVEQGNYQLLQPFFERIRPATFLPEALSYRWYWRNDEHMLDKRMRAFFTRMDASGSLADIQERYFGFFPDTPNYGGTYVLRQAISEKLPLYRDTILTAARRYQIDPLLLIAVIFQESAFNPDAVSITGVRGLMQLTEETAGRLGATDRTDPQQSIHYGAKYLKRLWEELGALNLPHWDRWAMTLSSYNQGIGHLF